MGQVTSTPIQYGVFIGEKKKGETQALRNPIIGEKPLREINTFGVQTVWDALKNTVDKRGTNNFLGTRKRISKDNFEKKYTWKSYQQVYNEAIDFAKGVSELKLCPEFTSQNDGTFKFIGIYSRNREEWVIADLASHCNSVTVVTIYDTLGDQTISFILQQTQLTTMVIESRGFKKILGLAKESKTEKLKNLIVLDKEDDQESINELQKLGFNIYTFEDIKNAGKGKQVEFVHAKPETICTICYTSGTTGLSKGAMVSHKALLSEIDIMKSAGLDIVEQDVYLSYLPLAHIMERLIVTLILTHGFSYGFYTGDPRRLMEDAALLGPTLMTGVPRVFQRVYEGINKKLSTLSPLMQKIAKKAIEQKIYNYREYGVLTHALWDKIIFGKIKALLGGRIRYMLIGSAPMDRDVLDFLKIAFSCAISEGYGQTEDCAGMLISHASDKFSGHLGGPGFANEVKLVDVPDLEYYTDSEEPKGEICIRGPVLFSGYLNDIENTKKAIDPEGWLHTGDVGIILKNHGNAIKIIDRVKNIFKLSQGEYIAPEKLENVFVTSLYVNQIFVYGDSLKNYLVAIVVPREETCVEFFTKKGINCTIQDVNTLYDRKDLKNEILNDLTRLAKENDFKGFEVIKNIYISKEPFTVDNDLCTPSLKIKRHNAKKYFAKEFEKMYNSS